MVNDEIHKGVVAYPSVDKLVMRGVAIVIVQNANRFQWLDGCAVEYQSRLLPAYRKSRLQLSVRTLRPTCQACTPAHREG